MQFIVFTALVEECVVTKINRYMLTCTHFSVCFYILLPVHVFYTTDAVPVFPVM